MTQKEHILCPSSRCEEGAILLGVIQHDGHVSIASDRFVIDNQFVQIAHLGRSPERRFRFAGDCANNSCVQWSEGRCKVIDKAIKIFGENMESTELRSCSIRNQCRWYKQCGGKACAICPEIITDL